MPKKNIVPWNTRIGDVGESEIEARLRRVSTATKIVRDVGIDFYCDLLINEKPILPFYVQAKSSQHWDDKQGRSIDKGTLLYWLNRPYPVYIFFYDEDEDICYWYSVEQFRYNLINSIFLTESASVYISFTGDNVFSKDENIEFKSQLQKDYHSLMAFRGIAQFKGAGYIKLVPPPPRSENEYKLMKGNAKAILYSLIQLHINSGEKDQAINPDFASVKKENVEQSTF